MSNRYKKLLESIGEDNEQMRAADMLILTNMLNKIISDMDDFKAMLKEVTQRNFENNFEEDE